MRLITMQIPLWPVKFEFRPSAATAERLGILSVQMALLNDFLQSIQQPNQFLSFAKVQLDLAALCS